MNYYKIHYEVDTGFEYRRDTAIVKAESRDAAVEKLGAYISSIGNDYTISEVFFVTEFIDDIFSNQFNPRRK